MKEGSDPHLIELLRNAKKILVFTGAGISTGSGISDFRGPRGVWKRRQPVYYQDFLTSETARVEYWDQKLEAWGTFRQAQPNAVHLAIVDLEKAHRLSMVVTQNIDGLHARAGTSAERLVELHGTNQWVECQSCSKRSDPEPHMESFRRSRRSPRCVCGGFLKPATISFGQNLLEDDLDRARTAAAETDLVVALGSTLSVYPAASVPLAAAEKGVSYVIVNQGKTDHDSHPSVTLRFEGDVTNIFPPAVASALGPGLASGR